jgi:hypothetical protein
MRMKNLLLVLTICLLLSGSLLAQSDTLYVPALTEGGDFYVNSLIEFVAADTNAAGEQLHKVYKLERGQFYVLDNSLILRKPVEIYADPPEPGDPAKVPAKILSNVTIDGGTATQNLIEVYADFTIKNVWLAGMNLGHTDRGWGYPGHAIAVQDSFVTVRMDGVWLDYNGWSMIGTVAPHTSWFINGLHARNQQNPGDQWTTFAFWFENSAVVDTFVVTNSTWFQANSFFLFPPPVVQYLKIDHCTFVNTLKWPLHRTQWQREAYITNSIFYNMSALSMTEAEQEGQDSKNLEFGLINIDTLAANADPAITPGKFTIPEKERIFHVKNNLYYWSDGVQDYWNDFAEVKPALWMNARTEAMFADNETWPGLVAENNWNMDPLFNDFPALADANAELYAVIRSIRQGVTYEWDWDVNKGEDFYRLIHEHPLPENFRSYSGLTGTDGLPLGDLRYYPEDALIPARIEIVEPPDVNLMQPFPLAFNMDTDVVDWEGYTFFPFSNAALARIGNPDKSGLNETNFVLEYTKPQGSDAWAGFFYHLETPINLTDESVFKLKVWSPRADIEAIMKLEVQGGPATGDLKADVTVAGEWIELEWDLSGQNKETNWNLIVVIMDIDAHPVPTTETWYLDDFRIENVSVVSVDRMIDAGIPDKYELSQNYPNPFNPSTTIRFAIPEASNVQLEIYNIMGQRVKVLISDEMYNAGFYEVVWNGRDQNNLPVASGMYMYRITAGEFTKIKSMVFLK